jgi:DNA-binding transcriptional ArsR family regulator
MALPSQEELDKLHYHICQAVGDTKRLLILYALNEQPRYVTELAALLDMAQPTVSRHLAILLERRIVVKERSGAAMVYRLADHRVITVMDAMRSILADVLAAESVSNE